VTFPRALLTFCLLAFGCLTLWMGLKARPVKAGLIAAPPEAWAGPRVTLRYMVWGRENEVRQEREKLQRFVAENPDIQIELIQVGGTDYQIKLATMLAGGVAPDVFMVHEAMFPTLAENDLIMPLDQMVEGDPDVDLDDFFPRVVEECRYKGQLYKLPMGFNTVVLYYNKDMFDEAGVPYPDEDWTWADLLDAARRLTRRQGQGPAEVYGVQGFGPWLSYVMMMWQNGGELFDEDGRLVVGTPEYVQANAEALQFCADLQHKWKVEPTIAAEEGLPADPFVARRTAMALAGTWLNNQCRGHQGLRWDLTAPPHRKQRATLVFGGSPVVNRATKHPREAWRLMKAMLSDWWQLRIAAEARSLPAKKSIAENLTIPGIPADVHLDRIFRVIEYARSQPVGPDVSEWMERPLSDLRDRVLLDSISGPQIAEELRRIQQQYDQACPYCSKLH